MEPAARLGPRDHPEGEESRAVALLRLRSWSEMQAGLGEQCSDETRLQSALVEQALKAPVGRLDSRRTEEANETKTTVEKWCPPAINTSIDVLCSPKSLDEEDAN